MEFKDKLNFLMKITQVSNKEISKAIAVDPSLVSLLRSGKRKPPQNNIHIINMAIIRTAIVLISLLVFFHVHLSLTL